MATTLKELSRNVTMRTNGAATGDRSKMDKWQQDAAYDGRSYSLTLFYHGRRMTTNFYQGSAHTEPPTVEDVLDCLLMDAGSVSPEYSLGTFEDFCDSLGFDRDSRKAEASFKQCVRQTAKLKSMLNGSFDSFMQAERN